MKKVAFEVIRTVVLALIAFFLFSAAREVARLDREIGPKLDAIYTALDELDQDDPIVKATKTFEWTDADCFDRSVVTNQQPEESKEDFCRRHDAAVAHDLQTYGVKERDLSASPGGDLVWLSHYLKENPREVIATPFTKTE